MALSHGLLTGEGSVVHLNSASLGKSRRNTLGTEIPSVLQSNSSLEYRRSRSRCVGQTSPLNRTRQKRIRRRIPARRLKPLPGSQSFIYIDKYMLSGVYQKSGICLRHHRGTEPPRDIEPPGLVTTVGWSDRASTWYAADDRVQAPASAARGRLRGIHGGRTAPSLPAET